MLTGFFFQLLLIIILQKYDEQIKKYQIFYPFIIISKHASFIY